MLVPEHSAVVNVPVDAFMISSILFLIKPGAVVPISPGDFNLAVKAETGTTLSVSVPVMVSASVANSTSPLLPVFPASPDISTVLPVRATLIPSPSSIMVTAESSVFTLAIVPLLFNLPQPRP